MVLPVSYGNVDVYGPIYSCPSDQGFLYSCTATCIIAGLYMALCYTLPFLHCIVYSALLGHVPFSFSFQIKIYNRENFCSVYVNNIEEKIIYY